MRSSKNDAHNKENEPWSFWTYKNKIIRPLQYIDLSSKAILYICMKSSKFTWTEAEVLLFLKPSYVVKAGIFLNVLKKSIDIFWVLGVAEPVPCRSALAPGSFSGSGSGLLLRFRLQLLVLKLHIYSVLKLLCTPNNPYVLVILFSPDMSNIKKGK